MGIRSRLYRMGANTAQAVAGSRTVQRSVGGQVRRAVPMGPVGSTGRGMARAMPMPGRTLGNRATRSGLGPVMARGRSTRTGLGGRIPRGATGVVNPRAGAMRFGGPTGLGGRGIGAAGGSLAMQSVSGLRPAAAAPRVGRMRRMGQFAKRHPFMIGGAGVALGYNAGRQDTGPGITTTNTTGVYQY